MVICSEGIMANETSTDEVPQSVKDILVGAIPHHMEKSENSDDSESSSDEESKKSSDTKDMRGRRPGGRFWKTDRKRFSSVVATRGLRRITWEQKEQLRRELKDAKELTRSHLEERARLKREKRERRLENIKRREENARKAEIVQVIKNPAKLKKMKRKQLRSIEKRDTTAMV